MTGKFAQLAELAGKCCSFQATKPREDWPLASRVSRVGSAAQKSTPGTTIPPAAQATGKIVHQSQTPCQQPLSKLVEFRLKTRIEKGSERAERTHSFVVTWSPNNLRDCYGIRIAKETVKQLQILKASCQESRETSGGSFPVFLGSRAQATYSRSPEPQSFINEFVYIFLFFFLFFILRFADSLVN